MAQVCGVSFPTTRPEARVDQLSCCLLVEVDRLRRLGRGPDDELECGWLDNGGCLNPGKLLLECEQGRFRFGRERFPDRPFLGQGVGAILRAATCVLRLRRSARSPVRGRERGHLLRAQPLQIVPQRGSRVGRRPRWLERASPEAAIAERAIEPDGKLACDLETSQRRRMVAPVLLDGLVAEASQVVESACEIGRPAPRRSAAMVAKACAARRSNGRTRPPKSSSSMPSISAVSALRRLPLGNRAAPYRSSASVIAAMNMLASGWPASQGSTAVFGAGRISSERTLVSSKITG